MNTSNLKAKIQYFFDEAECNYNIQNIIDYVSALNLTLSDKGSYRPKFFTDTYKYSCMDVNYDKFQKIKFPEILNVTFIMDGLVRSNVVQCNDKNYIICNNEYIIIDEEAYSQVENVNEILNSKIKELKELHEEVDLIDVSENFMKFKTDNSYIFTSNSTDKKYIVDLNSKMVEFEKYIILYNNNINILNTFDFSLQCFNSKKEVVSFIKDKVDKFEFLRLLKLFNQNKQPEYA